MRNCSQCVNEYRDNTNCIYCQDGDRFVQIDYEHKKRSDRRDEKTKYLRAFNWHGPDHKGELIRKLLERIDKLEDDVEELKKGTYISKPKDFNDKNIQGK